MIYILMFPFLLHAQETISPEKQNNTSPASKLIPNISLSVDFSYVYRNMEQTQYDALGIPGFTGAAINVGTLNQTRGINFNYGDLTLYSTVDPFFDLFAVIGLSETGAAIEEAYAKTLAMPWNLQLKMGKFYSSFGRLNEIHSHAWDFSDQPLVFLAMFGPENLNEKGVRLTWLAPTDFYLLLGGEALTADNAVSFGSVGFSDPAALHSVKNAEFPGLYTAYAKTSFDIDDLVILAGVSAARGSKLLDNGIANSGGFGVSGSATIFGADLYLKYIIDSYRYLAWQSEFLYRYNAGSMFFHNGSTSSLIQNQSGFYTQLIWRFSEPWRAGIRYDLIQKNQGILAGAMENLPQNLPRYTVMLEYSPSEFSKFRLQYNYDLSQYDGSAATINHQVSFDMNWFIGTHGAHSF